MSHRWRLASDVATNAPLRVPTNTRTPLIAHSFLGSALGAQRPPSPDAAAYADLLAGQAGDLHDRPNLHRPQRGARKPARDVDRLVQIPDVDDEVAAELLARLRERTVGHDPFAVPHPDAGRRRHGVQRGGGEIPPGRSDLMRNLRRLPVALFLLRLVRGLLIAVHQQHVFHLVPSISWSVPASRSRGPASTHAGQHPVIARAPPSPIYHTGGHAVFCTIVERPGSKSTGPARRNDHSAARPPSIPCPSGRPWYARSASIERGGMMRYVCLIYHETMRLDAMPGSERQAAAAEALIYGEELRRQGYVIAAEALQSGQTAMTVRLRNGRVSTAEGPAAEATEELDGFILIDARDLNEALQVASKM